jgi:hypothetical protein
MRALLVASVPIFLGCAAHRLPPPAASPAPPDPADASARVLAIADEYLARSFAQDPESATLEDWPAADHGAVADVSPAALDRWRAYEDGLSARLHAVAPPRSPSGPG